MYSMFESSTRCRDCQIKPFVIRAAAMITLTVVSELPRIINVRGCTYLMFPVGQAWRVHGYVSSEPDLEAAH